MNRRRLLNLNLSKKLKSLSKISLNNNNKIKIKFNNNNYNSNKTIIINRGVLWLKNSRKCRNTKRTAWWYLSNCRKVQKSLSHCSATRISQASLNRKALVKLDNNNNNKQRIKLKVKNKITLYKNKL